MPDAYVARAHLSASAVPSHHQWCPSCSALICAHSLQQSGPVARMAEHHLFC